MKHFALIAAIMLPAQTLANGPEPAPPVYSCWNGAIVSHPGKCGQRGAEIINSNQAAASASASTGPITIDTRGRAVAAPALAAPLPGYGPQNCFGDTNPSGQLSLSWAGILAGGAASASKAHNVCAVYHLMGPEAAIQYLQRADNKLPRRVEVQSVTRVTCPLSHPVYVEGRGCRR